MLTKCKYPSPAQLSVTLAHNLEGKLILASCNQDIIILLSTLNALAGANSQVINQLVTWEAPPLHSPSTPRITFRVARLHN